MVLRPKFHGCETCTRGFRPRTSIRIAFREISSFTKPGSRLATFGISSSNGLLGNVAVIRRVPANNQPSCRALSDLEGKPVR